MQISVSSLLNLRLSSNLLLPGPYKPWAMVWNLWAPAHNLLVLPSHTNDLAKQGHTPSVMHTCNTQSNMQLENTPVPGKGVPVLSCCWPQSIHMRSWLGVIIVSSWRGRRRVWGTGWRRGGGGGGGRGRGPTAARAVAPASCHVSYPAHTCVPYKPTF